MGPGISPLWFEFVETIRTDILWSFLFGKVGSLVLDAGQIRCSFGNRLFFRSNGCSSGSSSRSCSGCSWEKLASDRNYFIVRTHRGSYLRVKDLFAFDTLNEVDGR